MRVGIAGWGSEGDLRPLVALGARLRQAGHEVRLVLSPVDAIDWGATCRAMDVTARIVPEGLPATLEAICDASKSSDPTKVSRELVERAFTPFQDQMYEAVLDLARESDVVVGLFSSHYAKAACIKSGTPHVAVHYFPGMWPSRIEPPFIFPRWKWLAPFAWWLMKRLLDLVFLKQAARFFASKGLPPVKHVIPDVMFSDRLNLHACSPTLHPAPADWDERQVVCGDFVAPADATPWAPSAELRSFLDAGDKPVLVSFGTMELLAPARAKDLVVSASRLAGVRTIMQTKSGAEGRDGNMMFVRWAPHRALAPLCSAMVIHGGAGTTHAALRAGLPAVPVPFIMEQGIWARLLGRAGSATRPLPFWKATPEKLAARMREATGSEMLRKRAVVLAESVAREDGTGRAVELLESLRA
jgi:UDP:flavonoid glycosyltransferase YjiC (YdhE family)